MYISISILSVYWNEQNLLMKLFQWIFGFSIDDIYIYFFNEWSIDSTFVVPRTERYNSFRPSIRQMIIISLNADSYYAMLVKSILFVILDRSSTQSPHQIRNISYQFSVLSVWLFSHSVCKINGVKKESNNGTEPIIGQWRHNHFTIVNEQ